MDRNALNSIPLGAGAPNNLVRSKVSQILQQQSGMSGNVEFAFELTANHTQESTATVTRLASHWIATEHQQTGNVTGRQQIPVSGCVATVHELASNGRSNRLLASWIDQEHQESITGISHAYHRMLGYVAQPHTQLTSLTVKQLIAKHGCVSEYLSANGEVISSCLTAIHGSAGQEHLQTSATVGSRHTAIHIALVNALQLTDHVIAYDLTQEWAPLPRRVALGKQPRSVAVSSLDTSSGVQ